MQGKNECLNILQLILTYKGKHREYHRIKKECFHSRGKRKMKNITQLNGHEDVEKN